MAVRSIGENRVKFRVKGTKIVNVEDRINLMFLSWLFLDFCSLGLSLAAFLGIKGCAQTLESHIPGFKFGFCYLLADRSCHCSAQNSPGNYHHTLLYFPNSFVGL